MFTFSSPLRYWLNCLVGTRSKMTQKKGDTTFSCFNNIRKIAGNEMLQSLTVLAKFLLLLFQNYEQRN
jgi:hypothetical protein